MPTLYQPIKWTGMLRKFAWSKPSNSTGKKFENVTLSVTDGIWPKFCNPYVSNIRKNEKIVKYLGDGLSEPQSDSPAPNEQTLTVNYNSFYPPGFKKYKIIDCEGFIISQKYYDKFIIPFLKKNGRF